MIKRITAIVLTVAMMLALSVTAFANELRFEIDNPVYLVNGVEHTSEAGVSPFFDAEYNRNMMPLRLVAEALGAEVDWDGEAQEAVIIRGGTTLRVPVGEPLPGGMGNPVMIEGSIFVPVAYVAQAFGATTRWDGDAQAVYVYDQQQPAPAPPLPPVPAPTPTPIPAATEPIDIEGMSAYELFDLSNDILMEAGSVAYTLDVLTNMVLTFEGETMEEAMLMTGTVYQVMRSETDMDMRMELNMLVESMTIPMVSYFRGNVMYTNALGVWDRVEVDIEEVLAQAGMISFPEEGILNQVITETGTGFELDFIVSGEAMNELMDTMFADMDALLDGLADINIDMSDVIVTVVLDNAGNLVSMDMILDLTMGMDGTEDMDAMAIEMAMEMSMVVTQIGGVTITFPEILDDL